MRGPLWWFSLPACVVAVFAQCCIFCVGATTEDLAANPIRDEAPAQAAMPHESPNGAPVAPETGSRPTTSRKEDPSTGQVPKGATTPRESQNRAPAAHESRKKEPPGARERRAVRDKLNSESVGIVFGGMDDADFSEAVDLGAVIGSPDIKIMSMAGNGANETVTDLLFARCGHRPDGRTRGAKAKAAIPGP